MKKEIEFVLVWAISWALCLLFAYWASSFNLGDFRAYVTGFMPLVFLAGPAIYLSKESIL